MEEKRRDSIGTPPPSTSMAEVTPSELPTSRRRGGGQKRKSTSINSGGGSSTPQTVSSKRLAREKPPPVPFPPIHMNGPLTRARLQPYNSSSFSDVVPVKSEVEAREAAAKAEEIIRVNENWEALEAKIQAEYEAITSRDANVHVVPIHAGWFSWTKIHHLEERMLPSFFNGKLESRTPEIYMEIRNWITKKFHLNPDVQIESKDLSELTVGEVDARQEVMEFLDYWGLINYHPFPDQESTSMDVDADASKDETGETNSSVEQLFKFETVQSWAPLSPRMYTAMPAMSSGLFPESAAADEVVKSEGPAVEYHCNSCTADCSRKRYHCQKQADFDLCADCFNNGKFDSNMSPSDFILMEPGEAGGASGGNWTDQETLLLLEAIELFRDNWSEIAEHVATKTKAQCILHFVQMPIEDAFVNHDDERNDAPKENGIPVSENPAPNPDKDGDTAPKDVPEKKESEGGTTENQNLSSPMEMSKTDEANESVKSPGVEENFALKALKEAFEAVGSLPAPGKRLSFADAGNPVMTLAAFLVRLVDPTIATASVRNLLKLLTGNYSSEQLAARHCFPLEDPPDGRKNFGVAANETATHEAQKNKDEHAERQEDTPDSIVEGMSSRSNENNVNKDSALEEHTGKRDSASKDEKPVASPSSDHTGRSDTMKEPHGRTAHEEAQPPLENKASHSDFRKEQAPKDAEVSGLASNTELQPNTLKESVNGAPAGEAAQSEASQKDEDKISISEKKESDPLGTSDSSTEKGDKEGNECGGEKKESLPTKNNLDVNMKLSQAAVTAISAAAVKAKLLADQEEDQILQLSAFLIDRQLYKLENKLSFFNDMENVVMRVKEQLDRSKQRLFHERAQIIATRFARPPPQVLPPNRGPVNYPSSGPRPFMGMNSLRPPMSRPMMTANPNANTFMTATPTGSTGQPNVDKLSSDGMK